MVEETRVISLHQPWASYVAWGVKRFETRSWATRHRGPIAIHAAKKQSESQRVQYENWLTNYAEEGNSTPHFSDLPFGEILCVANLVNCHLITEGVRSRQSEQEIYVGDWGAGRFAWELSELRVITPIPYKGQQGIWLYPGKL